MHTNLPEGYGCVLAPSMVDAAIGTMVPVHVFNPNSYLVVIRQDSVLGQVDPVELVSTQEGSSQDARTLMTGIISQQQDGCH